MKPVSCLLIDDDPDEHDIFLFTLGQSYDCSDCWCAHSIDEALSLSRSGKAPQPDYIFLDWNIIYMEGLDAIQRLRSEKSLEAAPLFVLSLLPPLLEEQDTQRLGVKRFVNKQGTTDEFAAALAEVIEGQ